jgi:hypothetical protein
MSLSNLSEQRWAFLAKLHEQVIELLRGVHFDKNPHRDGYLICLYASMIELCGGVVILIKNDRKTSLSPVFRTFLEAYVDFKNAAADRSYVNHSHARHHKDWIKVLSPKRPDNPFLAAILAHEQRDASLHRHEIELKKLREQGIRPLKADERFERAGMADEYFAIYHFESDSTHNSWQAMIGRHFEKTESGFQLALYKAHQLDDYETYLDGTAALLLDATATVHQQLNSGKQAEVEALQRELDAIRALA